MYTENRTIDDGRGESANMRADRNWNELMQELRVMQTGAQVLTGFLLAVAFQPRFTELSRAQLAFYLTLVVLATLATILSIAPVVLHRALFRKGVKPRLVTYGTRFVSIDLVIVLSLTVGVLTFIVQFALGDHAAWIALIVSVTVVAGVLVTISGISRKARRVDLDD
ncbi:DUF6328 family protein [Actinomycetaceae bacterium MB13-C1-2]|nr:DUF6328 family protein [Actinomycetaceae bacterium MB13-C1-2]